MNEDGTTRFTRTTRSGFRVTEDCPGTCTITLVHSVSVMTLTRWACARNGPRLRDLRLVWNGQCQSFEDDVRSVTFRTRLTVSVDVAPALEALEDVQVGQEDEGFYVL